jgi:uncharacterized Zn-finger protein
MTTQTGTKRSTVNFDQPETIYVETTTVACDGGGGALGHPRVWLKLENGMAECGYCDRRYVLKAGSGHGH